MAFIRIEEDKYETFQMPESMVGVLPVGDKSEVFPEWVREHMTCMPYGKNTWYYYFDTAHGHVSHVQTGDWFVGANGKMWVYKDKDFKRMFREE